MMEHRQPSDFQHPQGFLSVAKNVGIKDSTLDLTVIFSTVRARAAAMFTRNRFPGAPVVVGRKHIANGFVQALVINSKNANVAMGQQGIDNAVATAKSSAQKWVSMLTMSCPSPPGSSAGRCRWTRFALG